MPEREMAPEFVPPPVLFGPEALPAVAGQALAEGVLQITLAPDGRLTVRGPRAAVAEFLLTCARYGWVIRLNDLSWCG